ncbi:MAG TPA: lysophospholipid acyltransferase family protein [Candidatus Omnitrophota bacterium]|nr:lysophospholipid acyltransferase family protein [Candidatus Omnitrophota bacterium]
MEFKSFRRNFEYTLAWWLVVVSSWIVHCLPFRGVYVFSRFLGWVWYLTDAKHRWVALDNLRHALGGNVRDLKRIARKSFISMATSGVEMLYCIGKSEAFMKNWIRLERVEYLKQAMQSKKGIILVSAHFGNFPFLLPRLSLDGYKTAVVMRPMKEERVEQFFAAEVKRYNIRAINTIPRSRCVPAIIRSLREQEMVFIPLDQNFGTAGVFVDFFGRKAATATGPVVLAQRTGAVIVPCFIIRDNHNRHTIVFEPPFKLQQAPTEEATIAVNIQRLTAIIETYIRKYPGEWGWIHRRWKAKMKPAASA